ncbi:MAG TPA: DUF3526 domain-containing protein [Sphingomonas sp.]
MTALALIAGKDRVELRRDRRLLVAVLLVIALALAAVGATWMRVADHARDRAAATAMERASWLGQGARDPHSAAHFAQWAFRPIDAPALLDPAATPYAGTATWLEAHARNPAAFRPAEDRAATLDLGEMSAGWVLQTLGPLLAFLLGAGLVARERERGTLRLMLASGAPAALLVRAKAAGLLGTVALIALPVLAAAGAAVLLAPVPVAGDAVVRTLLWCAVHFAWLAVAVLVAVAVSARARTTGAALVLLIGIWVVAVPLVPRAIASVVESVHPTPSGARFWAEAQAEMHEGQEARTAALEAGLLARYGVARVEDLPVSFRGASLDAGERFGNAVFARRYVTLDAIHGEQRGAMRAGALLSPLLAVQNLSAALAGTDNRHLRHFDEQAEAERQRVVNALNRDVTLNGVGDAAYKADERLWGSFAPFRPTPLTVGEALRAAWPDLLILAGWLFAVALLVRRAGRALARETVR